MERLKRTQINGAKNEVITLTWSCCSMNSQLLLHRCPRRIYC